MVIMRECKIDSRDLAYENTDKLALPGVGKSSELAQCIKDLPEDIPANDQRVDLIVKMPVKQKYLYMRVSGLT